MAAQVANAGSPPVAGAGKVFSLRLWRAAAKSRQRWTTDLTIRKHHMFTT